MELEAIVGQKGHFGYTSNKDLYDLLEGNWGYEFSQPEQEEEYGSFEFHESQIDNSKYTNWDSVPPPSSTWPYSYLDQLGANNPNSSSEHDTLTSIYPREEFHQLDPITPTRPRPRRSRSKKNIEEIENQRITHIAVERNRRKQMNEYLSALRGLMPDSYVQRSDQASIVGGAINYVKELEHKLHFLSSGKNHTNQKFDQAGSSSSSSSSSLPFDEFFAFPQYSTSTPNSCESTSVDTISANADIEVTVVESHASLKIKTRKRQKQLVKLVSGLQSLRLTVLHLNVSTVDQTVLYSLSVKVEDDSNLTSVDEIATVVNEMLGRIQQEAALF